MLGALDLDVDIFGLGPESDAIVIDIFGFEFELIHAMIYIGISLLVVLAISIIIGIVAERQDVHKSPAAILIIAQWLWEFGGEDVAALSDDKPKERKTFLHAYATNIFLFLMIANTMSLWGGHSPFANVFMAIGLGIIVIILVHGLGAAGGIGTYLRKYREPFLLFIPFNIIAAISEIISISMRMFGNTLAAMILAELLRQAIIGIAFGIGYPLYPFAGGALMLYDIFIAYIQALLFTRLSMTYIREKLPLEHEN